MIRVNDIYGSIQGEGVNTGVPMVILRLQGCDVACPFCDTKETWGTRGEEQVPTLAEALGQSPSWTEMDPRGIVDHIRAEYPSFAWVLITGGEPSEQSLAPLVNALHATGLRAALETSGTGRGHVGANMDWVCVSPKIDMPGGRRIIPEVVAEADEIKHVVGKPSDIEQLDQLLSDCGVVGGSVICLQPMSRNQAATQLCVRTVQERAWRLSPQMHKYLDLP